MGVLSMFIYCLLFIVSLLVCSFVLLFLNSQDTRELQLHTPVHLQLFHGDTCNTDLEAEFGGDRYLAVKRERKGNYALHFSHRADPHTLFYFDLSNIKDVWFV
jgi:hypothetical protein